MFVDEINKENGNEKLEDAMQSDEKTNGERGAVENYPLDKADEPVDESVKDKEDTKENNRDKSKEKNKADKDKEKDSKKLSVELKAVKEELASMKKLKWKLKRHLLSSGTSTFALRPSMIITGAAALKNVKMLTVTRTVMRS